MNYLLFTNPPKRQPGRCRQRETRCASLLALWLVSQSVGLWGIIPAMAAPPSTPEASSLPALHRPAPTSLAAHAAPAFSSAATSTSVAPITTGSPATTQNPAGPSAFTWFSPRQENMSLPKVVERALHDNLAILTTRNRVSIARGSYTQSFAPLMPNIRVLYSIESFKGGEVIQGAQPVNLDRITYRPTVSGDYTISTGGKPIFQILAARQQLFRSKLGVTMATQKALLDACTSYFIWLKDIERERLSSHAVAEAQGQLWLRQKRLEADLGTRLEVRQAETVVKDRQNLALSTQNDRANSAITLQGHLNYALDAAIEPEPDSQLIPLTFWREQPNQGLRDLFLMAEAHRPEIKALTSQIAEARAQAKAAWADVFPNITLSGYARRIGPNMDNLRKTQDGVFAISVDVLKNMGVNTIGAIQSAKAKTQDAVFNRDAQIQGIQKAISEAWLNFQLYKNQLALEQQKCWDAQEGYRIAKARFEAGLAINLEVVQAENTLTAAQLSLQNTIMEYNNAQLQLLYETGQLTPESILTAQAIALPALEAIAETKVPAMAQATLPSSPAPAPATTLKPVTPATLPTMLPVTPLTASATPNEQDLEPISLNLKPTH